VGFVLDIGSGKTVEPQTLTLAPSSGNSQNYQPSPLSMLLDRQFRLLSLDGAKIRAKDSTVFPPIQKSAVHRKSEMRSLYPFENQSFITVNPWGEFCCV